VLTQLQASADMLAHALRDPRRPRADPLPLASPEAEAASSLKSAGRLKHSAKRSPPQARAGRISAGENGVEARAAVRAHARAESVNADPAR
jgi:hypothetical protein